MKLHSVFPAAGRTLVKDHHYGSLCEQLRPCAASWEDIAKYLEFKDHEIANIKADPMKLMSVGSFMDGMIDSGRTGPLVMPGKSRITLLWKLLEMLSTRQAIMLLHWN